MAALRQMNNGVGRQPALDIFVWRFSYEQQQQKDFKA
jgi:hypothetical protein